MKEIGAWISVILAVSILGAAADLIIPKGKTEKAIKSFFAALTVLVIVMPLPSLLKGNFDDFSFSGLTQIDSEYIEHSAAVRDETVSKMLNTALEAEGYSGFTCKVKTSEDYSIKNVTVILEQIGILKNGVHIDKYDFTKTLVTYLNVTEDKVFYE